MARGTRRALLVQLLSVFVVRATRALCSSTGLSLPPQPRTVHRFVGTIEQSSASATSQTACMLLIRPSLRGLTDFLVLMRFSFNPTEEHSPGFKTAQHTNCRTSQERRHHHARIGSWISHPLRPLCHLSSREGAGGNQRLPMWCSCCCQHSS